VLFAATDWVDKESGLMDMAGARHRRSTLRRLGHERRRDSEDMRVGDALDFWRVEAADPGRMIRLRAEIKVPGRAWLEFLVEHQSGWRTLLTQTAFFEPKGLLGLLYWYVLYPSTP
jgi:Protein of unknown function (DUF2867)